jgi:transposase
MCETSYYIGVDVSKAKHDYYGSESDFGVLSNDRVSIDRFLAAASKRYGDSLHICMEHTGRYGNLLAERCWAKAIKCSLLDPKKVYHFKCQEGVKAKTDRLDALLLKRFATEKRPIPSEKAPPQQLKLKALENVRSSLVKHRAHYKTSLEQAVDPEAVGCFKCEIRHLDKKIEEIDSRILEVIASDEKARGLRSRFLDVQGIGDRTVLAVLVHLADAIGRCSDRQICNLAGLAPMADQSGTVDKSRHIRGGRLPVRNALYIAAWSASRHNPVLSIYYRHLVDELKKPANLALIAVARKLLCLLNRIARDPNFIPVKKAS